MNLEDKICPYFPEGMLKGLHVLGGVEYTEEISIAHLISNTSGLPDYFFSKTAEGKNAAKDLLEGKDESWPLEKIIEATKTLKPKFRPGRKGKAFYSDTNYELLGSIIETITGKPVGEVFREYIFDELGLVDTYAFHDIQDTTPAPMYYKSRQVHLPRYIASITVEGGIVSTADGTMKFLKAFFAGKFFPIEELNELKKWNLIIGRGHNKAVRAMIKVIKAAGA